MLDVRLFGEFKVSLDDKPIKIPSRPMQLLLAYLLLNAGTAYRRKKQAKALLAESLTLRREIGNKGGIACCLEKLAEIALTTGQRESAPRRDDDFRRAARLFGVADALRAPVNSAIDLVDQPEYARQLASVRAQLNEGTFEMTWS